MEEVLELIDYRAYFDLLDLKRPKSEESIIEALASDDLIIKSETGAWNITNLGAILFAQRLSKFPSLKRKAVRVILYQGNNKLKTVHK